MKIAVSGATGYIGERFSERALASGHQVVALSRRPIESSASHWIPYELSLNQAPVLPRDTDVVLHLAARTSVEEQQGSEQEVLAAELLIKASRDVGAKVIFLSSQSARANAPTNYGRTKWRIERLVLAGAGSVVRPGQVYGGVPRGLFDELIRAVRRLPVLPAFMPAPKVQPIHVDDLVAGLLRIADSPQLSSRVLCLAAPDPVSFTVFLRALARHRLRLWRSFIPIPTMIVSAGLHLVGDRLRRRLRLEQLRSLFDLPVMNTSSDLQSVGLQLRLLNSGMHPTGADVRRQLVFEGRALLSYVLKAQPGNATIRRYVRAIEALRSSSSLALPKPFVRWPVLLALIDGGNYAETNWNIEFAWRLDAATILGEASPAGARRYLGLGESQHVAGSIFRITRAVLSEAGFRLLSKLFAPITRLSLPRSLGARQ